MNIDPDAITPTWDHTVTVRGVAVPLLSPAECEADDCDHLPRGLLHLHRRIGAWLKRLLFGVSDTDTLRAGIAMTFVPECRHIAAKLTGGELVRLAAIYRGLQAEWIAGITRAAQSAAYAADGRAARPTGIEPLEAHGRDAHATGIEPLEAHGRDARPAGFRIPIVPGGTLPQWMGGHPVGRAKTTDDVIAVR